MASVRPGLPSRPTCIIPLTEPAARARLYGEPFFSVPQDLYIPPDALEVFLEAFEGPLDLLLYLIRQQNFNVLDIPMAEVTAQYLAYIRQLRSQNLELAGEYLLMAALLIEIKSRMLLPARKSETEDEPEDPRAELVRRLLAYEKIKEAASHLDSLPRAGRDFLLARATIMETTMEALPQVTTADLQQAWQGILQRARYHASHQVTQEQLSVRAHMSQILRQLADGEFKAFSELFAEHLDARAAVAVVVVHFLALLELARERLVHITQAQPYAAIYIRRSLAQAAA